jgi:hypothetical protein
VMVFPYEKDSDYCVRLLRREGFIAKAQTRDEVSSEKAGPTEAGGAGPRDAAGVEMSDGFVVLARDSIEALSRDRMLARAALGMPVIVAAHPRDVGLRRFARIRPHSRAGENFDGVLDFIAAKKLRPKSLEELARDALAADADRA